MATAQTIKKDGRTLYRVQIRRPTKGIKIDKYFDKKREADAYIREVEHAIKNGSPIAENVQGRKRFSDALNAFLEDPDAYKTPKGRQLKASAQKDRKNRLKWLSKHCFGDVVLKNLTWDLIDRKLKQQAQDRDWSPASRYRYETTLSRFLDYCKKQGWVSHNVMVDQERLNDSDRRERTYSDAEWRSLLEAADDAGGMIGMFLRLAWDTGARKGELLNLRWVDVEATDQKGLGAKLHLTDTKNREPRMVFISEDTYQLLQAHQQQYRIPSSALVFPARTTNGLWGVDSCFRDVRRKAGLAEPDERYGEVLTIHHIRHTWATRLGDSGVSLAQLMAAAGWKTPGMAERYMKRKESQSAEAALLLFGE